MSLAPHQQQHQQHRQQQEKDVVHRHAQQPVESWKALQARLHASAPNPHLQSLPAAAVTSFANVAAAAMVGNRTLTSSSSSSSSSSRGFNDVGGSSSSSAELSAMHRQLQQQEHDRVHVAAAVATEARGSGAGAGARDSGGALPSLESLRTRHLPVGQRPAVHVEIGAQHYHHHDTHQHIEHRVRPVAAGGEVVAAAAADTSIALRSTDGWRRR